MFKVGDLWCMSGDMHIHSDSSDGERLEKVIAQVINCGFDFCAISDHDTYRGTERAFDLSRQAGGNFPVIIKAQEATCSGCHILSYGTVEDFSRTGTLFEVCQNIRAAGGFAVAAHPDWEVTRKSMRESGLFEELIEKHALDGAELMNFPFPETSDDIAKEWTCAYTIEKFRRKEYFSVTCGSDAHKAAEITPQRRLVVFAETPDERGVLSAIFEKRLSVAVWYDTVIGTPEAVELYRQAESELKKRTVFTPVVSASGERTGTVYKIEDGFEDGVVFCGTLQQKSAKEFFKYGFSDGYDLLLGRQGGELCACCIESKNGVMLNSLPQSVGDEKAVPQFSVEKLQFPTDEKLFFTGKVNGVDFSFSTEEKVFSLSDTELYSDGNLLDVSVFSSDRIPLGNFHWNYPVAGFDVWHELKNILVQSPSPDGKEVSARFRFRRDAGSLTLEMQIEDRFFCQPYHGFSMYMGDSVQFGIAPQGCVSENDLISRKVWEFGIAMCDGVCELAVYNFPANRSKDDVKILKYSGRREGDKQYFEVEFPASFADIGAVFAFNMIYNINDGSGRRGYIAWRSGIGDRKRSSDWGFVM